MATTMSTPVVLISYDDLVKFAKDDDSINVKNHNHDDLIQKLGQAFGNHESALGILAVTGVPSLEEKRQRLLPLARRVALLEDKSEVVCEASKYQTGWSHGKEMFAGKPDLAKGSFYANPLVDDMATVREVPQNVKEANPGFFAPNVWPDESVPELEGALKELGRLVVGVGRLLARPCDAYVARECTGYATHNLSTLLQESKFCKARLLHYFAVDRSGASDGDFSDWCGWHNDHGSLTGLVPALYLDADGRQVSCGDDKSGLYIQARNGSICHVNLPPDAIGFQIGETSQIHSGGVLQATPHAVRGSSIPDITRESFAVFMEPEYFGTMNLPLGKTVEDVQDASIVLPSSGKTLSSRWKSGMNFGEFSEATFSAFY